MILAPLEINKVLVETTNRNDPYDFDTATFGTHLTHNFQKVLRKSGFGTIVHVHRNGDRIFRAGLEQLGKRVAEIFLFNRPHYYFYLKLTQAPILNRFTTFLHNAGYTFSDGPRADFNKTCMIKNIINFVLAKEISKIFEDSFVGTFPVSVGPYDDVPFILQSEKLFCPQIDILPEYYKDEKFITYMREVFLLKRHSPSPEEIKWLAEYLQCKRIKNLSTKKAIDNRYTTLSDTSSNTITWVTSTDVYQSKDMWLKIKLEP
jgi:hypothetical protein